LGKTANRFVAFFNIVRFKDVVEVKSHLEILRGLLDLKNYLDKLEGWDWHEEQGKKSRVKIVLKLNI